MISLSRRNRRSAGFTLIELLVVIGIIVLLAAILVPAVGHAYKVAQRSRMASDLQVISQALTAYKNDFGDYPRVMPATGAAPSPTGAVLLCWALVAPGDHTQDGADGPGFRTRGTTGRVWGPYLPPDRFQIVTVTQQGSQQFTQPAQTFNDMGDVLADGYGNPIFYFPAAKNAVPTQPGGFVSAYAPGTTPAPSVFNYNDNGNTNYGQLQCTIKWATGGWKLMSKMLGDTDGSGSIDANESPIATGPYLLWAAGPDQTFGTSDDVIDNGQSLTPAQ